MHLNKYLAVAALCGIVTSCQLEPLEMPSQELYTREFIKSYGLINPEQDWSVVKRASVTVTTMTATDVQILCREDGKTKLLGYFKGVAGSRTLEFDCPKPIEEVLVKGGDAFEIVPLGGELTIAPVVSRGITGEDRLNGYSLENGYFWSKDYVAAIQKELPEGDPENLNSRKVISDFSFVSDGNPFVVYPIYWQTTADDILGVYWYENGAMKTMDVFDNFVDKEDKNTPTFHNLYSRATYGPDISISSTPEEGIKNMKREGIITLTFNRDVKLLSAHKATLSAGTLSGPTIDSDKRTVTYQYSGLDYRQEVTFTLEAGSYEATDNEEGDKRTARNSKFTLKFTTEEEDITGKFVDDITVITLDPSLMGNPISATEASLVMEADKSIMDVYIITNTTNTTKSEIFKDGFELPIPNSTDKTIKFYNSIYCKLEKEGVVAYPIDKEDFPKNDYGAFKIVPKQDMLITVYTTMSDEIPAPILIVCKEEGAIETVEPIEKGTMETGVSDTDSKSRYGQYSTFRVYANQEYVATSYYDKQSRLLAGFTCRLAKNPTSSPRRTASRETPDENIDWNNLTAGTRVWDGNGEPGHNFSRATWPSKYAVSDRGQDEVITHRISFTLPKGVIFGFYIRNNNGAANITGSGNAPKPYTNYSMSSLNQTMPNSFFNNLDEGQAASGYFTEGWGTYNQTPPLNEPNIHNKLTKDDVTIKPLSNRKYSTAMTYTVEVNGAEIRYFSFEDWVDYDFNDIAFMVAPESENTEIVDGDIETNPYIFAVEDLGAIADSDIDFNDVVFAVEHVAGSEEAFVTMLAAGGTLPVQLFYNGNELDGSGGVNGEVVGGPFVGAGRQFDHVNKWFGHDAKNAVVGVGNGSRNVDYGNVTTMKIPVDPSFTLTDKAEATEGKVLGFSVKVDRGDGTYEEVTRPDATGEAPQMIILPGTWAWPLEKMPISGAYPGGISSNGEVFPSFQDWVNDGDGKGYQNANWHKAPSRGRVVEHPWDGSDAARKAFSELEQAD